MKLKLFIVLLSLTLFAGCREETKWRKMKRIVAEESGAFTGTDHAFDRSEVIKITSGLTYYSIDLEVKEGEIFLKEKEFGDMNYLYTIQKKCLDTVWYNQHIIRYVK